MGKSQEVCSHFSNEERNLHWSTEIKGSVVGKRKCYEGAQLTRNVTLVRKSMSEWRYASSFDWGKLPLKWSGLIHWANICHSCKSRGIGIYGCGMKGSNKQPALRALWNKVGKMVLDQILLYPYELKSGALWHRGEGWEGMIQLVCRSDVRVFMLRVLEWNEYHFRGSMKVGLISRIQTGWELISLSWWGYDKPTPVIVLKCYVCLAWRSRCPC